MLPFQLVKQLEAQSKLGTEDEPDAKEAAEISIMRSHTKAMQRSITLDVTTNQASPTASEKENHLSSQNKGAGTPLSLLIQSPRVLGTNNTPFSPSKKPYKSRPDADGLNARTKDVRDVLCLPPGPEFGEERASSFLSRITQGTHRQDLHLPDP